MLISDCSSDVCSSDLSVHETGPKLWQGKIAGKIGNIPVTVVWSGLAQGARDAFEFSAVESAGLSRLRVRAGVRDRLPAAHAGLRAVPVLHLSADCDGRDRHRVPGRRTAWPARWRPLVLRAAGDADGGEDRKSTRLNSSHYCAPRMPS